MTHPSPADDGGLLRFTFNGQGFRAREGETLAAALLRAGVKTLSDRTSGGVARGAFCWMGWCQECRVLHEGRWTEACRLVIRDGMVATARRTQDAK